MTLRPALQRLPALLSQRSRGRSAHYADIALGLWTPPIHISPQCSVWPQHETDALIGAQIAGASQDELRALVRQLMADRRQLMPALTPRSAELPSPVGATG